MLRFPTRPDLLAWLGGLSLGGLVAHWLAGGFAIQWLPQFSIIGDPVAVFRLLLSLALELVLAMLALKLAVEALLDTARGRAQPAGDLASLVTDAQALRQVFVLLGSVALAYLAWRIGGIGALAVVALLLAAVGPAAVMLLAEDDSLVQALHPAGWLEVWRRLGSGYGAMAVQLAGLAMAVAAASWFLDAHLPAWLAAPAGRFVLLYALLAGYHGLGGLMHAQHAELGIDLATAAAPPLHAAEEACLREAESLLSEDKPVEAIACLARLIRGRGASAPLHARYRQILSATGDRASLIEHGRDYIAVLLALHQDAPALALLHESVAMDPAFQVSAPQELSHLIAAADKGGQSQLAVSLAEQFLRRFPRDRDRQVNAMRAARLMCGRLGREADAIALLDAMLREAPEHALAPALRQARDAIIVPPPRGS